MAQFERLIMGPIHSISIQKHCFWYTKTAILADGVDNKQLYCIYASSFVKFYLLCYVKLVKQAVLNESLLYDYDFKPITNTVLKYLE